MTGRLSAVEAFKHRSAVTSGYGGKVLWSRAWLAYLKGTCRIPQDVYMYVGSGSASGQGAHKLG